MPPPQSLGGHTQYRWVMRSVAPGIGLPRRVRPAVDAYVAIGAVGLLFLVIHVANAVAGELFSTTPVGAYYGLDGLATWVALQLATYGVVGVGGTYLYVRATDAEATARPPARADARPLAGALAVVLGAGALAWLAPRPCTSRGSPTSSGGRWR